MAIKKKPTVWARQNKGIEGRQQRDQVQHLEQVESHSLARSREALERKARLYEEMRKRVRTSDDEESDEDILIDFDRKYWEDVSTPDHGPLQNLTDYLCWLARIREEA